MRVSWYVFITILDIYIYIHCDGRHTRQVYGSITEQLIRRGTVVLSQSAVATVTVVGAARRGRGVASGSAPAVAPSDAVSSTAVRSTDRRGSYCCNRSMDKWVDGDAGGERGQLGEGSREVGSTAGEANKSLSDAAVSPALAQRLRWPVQAAAASASCAYGMSLHQVPAAIVQAIAIGELTRAD